MMQAISHSIRSNKGDDQRKLGLGGTLEEFHALPQQLLDELIAEGLPVLPVNLMSSVKMRESHQACTPLIHLDRSHKLTQQFIELHNLLES